MADLQKYGRTENLFDYETMKDGKPNYYLDANGNEVENTNYWSITKYIPVDGTTFTLTRTFGGNAPAICLYDTNKNFITGLSYQGNQTVTISTNTNAAYIRFSYFIGEPLEDIAHDMLNIGSTALPYQPYLAWQHSLRKLATATDTFTTLPVDIYADGNNATVGISGNTVQSGTPTPSNPVDVQGVGVRTENLTTVYSPNTSSSGGLNFESIGDKLRIYGTASTYVQCVNTNDIILPSGTYTFSISSSIGNTGFYAQFRSVDGTTTYTTIVNTTTITFNEATTGRIRVIISATESKPYATDEVISIMINEGSTALPYEPFGVKIPILSGGTTTPVYLGEVESTRNIKKLVLTGEESLDVANSCFILWLYSMSYPNPKQELIYCTHYKGRTPTYRDSLADGQCMIAINQNQIAIKDLSYATADDFKAYLAQQYANGTPVCVWYVLATPTTGTVNEPLMKIGDYADTVSGITVPMITGRDTFDVDTTLKPSEASLNYTGWHDATVQEWDGSQWNE